MTEPEDLDEDLFADLYDVADDGGRPANTVAPLPASKSPLSDVLPPSHNGELAQVPPAATSPPQISAPLAESPPPHESNDLQSLGAEEPGLGPDKAARDPAGGTDSNSIGIKEDGKMFIGGLNWETTDQSLKDYFSQFGEVSECTVMRDAATGRSRGFGFLTFRDPKTVNTVMVKEHYLDNKIIDPKRAIPRDEQERTAKIFVGGVSQEATELDFKEYFMQYGRVIDATLMIDKDTGRPRGFGFVTFDSEAAVDATLQGDLMILGKPIEVKKAQPRGNMREEEERDRRGRRGARDDRFRDDYSSGMHQGQNIGAQAIANGMSPQMAAQYWQRMQQFMTQFMAAAQSGAMANAGMGGINPAMMQQMKQYQAMQQQMQGGRPLKQQGASDGRQGPAAVNPQIMQQMQVAASSPAQGAGGFGAQMGAVPTGPAAGPGPNGPSGRRSTPGYNAQDQLMFEQRKYEQQQARRATQDPLYQAGGPTSWEGMYDDVPQPSAGPSGGPRGGYRGGGSHRGGKNVPPPVPAQSAAPANAPTGPKNAGVPGANYRGGGRGGHRNYHPYRR